ncbi:MAG: hypothetical protein HYW86_02065 [Candidatus Roizmanbacteria bacterium]|nr:MAG: hypothetical protein HYW86_02065 [Candidatus Roizmanbacteria bacterium]
MGKLDELQIRKVRDLISPHNSNPRKLMQAVLQDLLYDPPTVPVGNTEFAIINKDVESIRDLLNSQFKTSVVIFNERYEREKLIGRGRWQIILPKDARQTLKDELLTIVEEEVAGELIADLATFFAAKLAPKLRKFRIFSLDIEDPKEIERRAESSFPAEYRDTIFFWKAGEMKDHVRANLLDYPFQPNSLAFISGIEAYPFYFDGFPLKTHIEFADKVAASLKPGGRAVFFPWLINSEKRNNRETLDEVKKHWSQKGLTIQEKKYSYSDLTNQMGDREISLTMHSPVFNKYRPYMVALTLIKPE